MAVLKWCLFLITGVLALIVIIVIGALLFFLASVSSIVLLGSIVIYVIYDGWQTFRKRP